jgi:hypothetical protein
VVIFVILATTHYISVDMSCTTYLPGRVRMYKMYANIHLCPSSKVWPSLYQISPKLVKLESMGRNLSVLIGKYDGH